MLDKVIVTSILTIGCCLALQAQTPASTEVNITPARVSEPVSISIGNDPAGPSGDAPAGTTQTVTPNRNSEPKTIKDNGADPAGPTQTQFHSIINATPPKAKGPDQ